MPTSLQQLPIAALVAAVPDGASAFAETVRALCFLGLVLFVGALLLGAFRGKPPA